MHLERISSATDAQDRQLFAEGVSRWHSVGHKRTIAHSNLQVIRTDKVGSFTFAWTNGRNAWHAFSLAQSRMAGQGESGGPAEGLRVHHFRIGKRSS